MSTTSEVQLKTQQNTAKRYHAPAKNSAVKKDANRTTRICIPKNLKDAQQGRVQIWIPKGLVITKTTNLQSTPAPIRERKPTVREHATINKVAKMTTQRWVKKTILKAQGYYQGKTDLWLPKQRTMQSENQHTPQVWQPTKSKAHSQVRVAKNGYHSEYFPTTTLKKKTTWQGKGKWIPKTTTIQNAATTHTKKNIVAYDNHSKLKLQSQVHMVAFLLSFNRHIILNKLQEFLASKSPWVTTIQDLSLAPHLV